MNVVLDSDVWISGIVVPSGSAAESLRQWRGGVFDVKGSAAQFAEIENILTQPAFAPLIGRSLLGRWPLGSIWAGVALVEPESVAAFLTDPADDLILGTALAARADCLVSGNDHLLAHNGYRGLEILPPRRFLVRITPG